MPTQNGSAALGGSGGLEAGWWQYLTDESGNPITDESGNYILLEGSAIIAVIAVDVAAFAGVGLLIDKGEKVGSAVFAGSGSANIATVHTPIGLENFAGVGLLTAVAAQPQTDTSNLNGAGALLVSAVEINTISAALGGAGSLTVIVGAWTDSAALGGAGSLTTTAVLIEAAAANFSGAGALTGAASIPSGGNQMGGSGQMAVSAELIAAASSSLIGAGAFAANAAGNAFTVTASLSGVGSLAVITAPPINFMQGTGGFLAVASSGLIVYPVKAWFKMARDNYDPMTLVRLKVTFTRLDTGALIDPTEIVLYRQLPDGSDDALSYLDGDITKDSEGKYHYDALLSVAGRWRFKWQGHGAVEAATPDVTVTVNESELVGDLWPARAGFNAAGALAA